MGKVSKNEDRVLEELARDQVMPKFLAKKSSLENDTTNALQAQYTTNNFSRNPLDTTLSRKKSKVEVDPVGEVQGKYFVLANLIQSVNTPYAKFFLNGWGTNAKYGARNVMKLNISSGALEEAVLANLKSL